MEAARLTQQLIDQGDTKRQAARMLGRDASLVSQCFTKGKGAAFVNALRQVVRAVRGDSPGLRRGFIPRADGTEERTYGSAGTWSSPPTCPTIWWRPVAAVEQETRARGVATGRRRGWPPPVPGHRRRRRRGRPADAVAGGPMLLPATTTTTSYQWR